jgi:hypothetical protein
MDTMELAIEPETNFQRIIAFGVSLQEVEK